MADEVGRRIAGRSLDGSDLPNEYELLFGHGVLCNFCARLTRAPHAIGALVLRRFNSLAETGEVSALAQKPANRENPDPYGGE